MDQFVGNTLEKAVTRRRRAQREAMAAAGANKEAVMTYGELRLGQTAAAAVAAVAVEPDKTVTVTKIPSHTLKVTTPGGSLVVNGGGGKGGSGHGHGQNGQTCSTCIASGESSCSSALSSLESVRSSSGYSQGPRGSSNSGCSETLGSELHLSPKNDTLYEQTRGGGGGGQQQQDPAARAAAMSAAVTAAAAASQRPPKPMRNQQHFNRNYYHGGGNNGHLLGGLRIVPAAASAEVAMRQSGGEQTPVQGGCGGGGLHYDTMASSASKPYQTLEMVDYVTAAEVDNNQNGEEFISSGWVHPNNAAAHAAACINAVDPLASPTAPQRAAILCFLPSH